MMEFRNKPVVIQAATFAEFVQHGRDSGANIVGGMPWSFTYKGHPVSHENDECYLISFPGGSHKFTPTDMLINDARGQVFPCPISTFNTLYDPV